MADRRRPREQADRNPGVCISVCAMAATTRPAKITATAMSSQPVMLTHLVAVSPLVEPPSSPLLVPVTSSTKLS
jgi:hypothetical protein